MEKEIQKNSQKTQKQKGNKVALVLGHIKTYNKPLLK